MSGPKLDMAQARTRTALEQRPRKTHVGKITGAPCSKDARAVLCGAIISTSVRGSLFVI